MHYYGSFHVWHFLVLASYLARCSCDARISVRVRGHVRGSASDEVRGRRPAHAVDILKIRQKLFKEIEICILGDFSKNCLHDALGFCAVARQTNCLQYFEKI